MLDPKDCLISLNRLATRQPQWLEEQLAVDFPSLAPLAMEVAVEEESAEMAAAATRLLQANPNPYLCFLLIQLVPMQTVVLQEAKAEIDRQMLHAIEERAEAPPAGVSVTDVLLARGWFRRALSAKLITLGRPREALPPAEESVGIFRQLYQDKPDAGASELARSLGHLAHVLSELGRQTESLVYAQQAIAHFRPLARDNPDAFAWDLASLLVNLAGYLSELGQQREAVAPSEEAIALFRRLAGRNRDAFTPSLIKALSNLADFLCWLGRPKDALLLAEEAVALCRPLVQRNPDAFMQELAKALSGLAGALGGLERWHEALPHAQEAVSLSRSMAQRNPDAFQRDLIRSLIRLAPCLFELRRWREALRSCGDLVVLLPSQVGRVPRAYAPIFWILLNGLAAFVVGFRWCSRAPAAVSRGVLVACRGFRHPSWLGSGRWKQRLKQSRIRRSSRGSNTGGPTPN